MVMSLLLLDANASNVLVVVVVVLAAAAQAPSPCLLWTCEDDDAVAEDAIFIKLERKSFVYNKEKIWFKLMRTSKSQEEHSTKECAKRQEEGVRKAYTHTTLCNRRVRHGKFSTQCGALLCSCRS